MMNNGTQINRIQYTKHMYDKNYRLYLALNLIGKKGYVSETWILVAAIFRK